MLMHRVIYWLAHSPDTLRAICVLAAVSAASKEWFLTLDRLLAVIVFLAGILLSFILNRFVPVRLRQYSLAVAMVIEVLLFLSASLLLSIETARGLLLPGFSKTVEKDFRSRA